MILTLVGKLSLKIAIRDSAAPRDLGHWENIRAELKKGIPFLALFM